MRIYITHCSATKEESLRNTAKKVTPDKLYTSEPIQRFMNKCKELNVKWAIFSDLHGILFPKVERHWYEKAPDTVTDHEFSELVDNFEQELGVYDEIFFFYDPERFHPLYKRLINETKINNKIILFSNLKDIN